MLMLLSLSRIRNAIQDDIFHDLFEHKVYAAERLHAVPQQYSNIHKFAICTRSKSAIIKCG